MIEIVVRIISIRLIISSPYNNTLQAYRLVDQIDKELNNPVSHNGVEYTIVFLFS